MAVEVMTTYLHNKIEHERPNNNSMPVGVSLLNLRQQEAKQMISFDQLELFTIVSPAIRCGKTRAV